MTEITNQLDFIPELLRDRVEKYWQDFQSAADVNQIQIPTSPDFIQSVFRVWTTSDYVAESCIRDPALLADLFVSGDILREYQRDEYVDRLKPLLLTTHDDKELEIVLRRFRRREMVRIIWRDLANFADLNGTIRELSALADACIDEAAKLLHSWQCMTMGMPKPYRGVPQQLVVLGLGKLGGEELNLSSDVDLIFAYPSVGDTQEVVNPVSHEQFFYRLGQRLIHVLNTVTSEGFVFRVDMRLRPLGESGPLVMPFDAMENYYLEQGRDWERYALIKARLISGNRMIVAPLMSMIRPFIYRQYLDYSAIQALREMHAMITQETKNRKLHGNVKLGAGGIREIEFIGQTFQLIMGGQEPRLQERRIIPVLKMLGEMKFLPQEAVEELLSAYTFLRNVEHRLQAVSDRQTHRLPTDEVNQLRLAFAMGFHNWELFDAALQRHSGNVNRHFQRLIAKPELTVHAETTPVTQQNSEVIWAGENADQNFINSIADMGFDDPQAVLKLLNSFREGRRFRNLDEIGRKRLNALMPQLLTLTGKGEQPIVTFNRLIDIIDAIMRRSTYMVLLLENPKALAQLVELCSISPWLSDQLARHPMLLGELLDINRLYAPLNLATLESSLRQALAGLPDDDLEQQMECLRRFKLRHLFRVAAMDVTGVLPLMRVSDHLTNIAEVILRSSQDLAMQHLAKRHGYLPELMGDNHFAIVAYGKLGGIELGYGSDLDVVFLYDVEEIGKAEQLMTIGENSIPLNVFYTRLGQRLLNMLEARTPSGNLYKLDTRLRPSGESGVLVTSMETFIEYQQQQAWTWEHQALVRARMITGNSNLIQRFELARQEILAKPRDPEKLQKDVREMRHKMREANKSASRSGLFDLKQGLGGITDIEFIVQYGVLRWANTHPSVMIYPDVIRIVESFATEGLLEIAEARLLSDAYRAYRAMVHRLDLQNQPAFVSEQQFRVYRTGVLEIWRKLLGE